jgi:hypothetical protein
VFCKEECTSETVQGHINSGLCSFDFASLDEDGHSSKSLTSELFYVVHSFIF